ncbi:hypothetical protein FRC11_003852, partial [Ceratobasidium sp. 423]
IASGVRAPMDMGFALTTPIFAAPWVDSAAPTGSVAAMVITASRPAAAGSAVALMVGPAAAELLR